MKASVPSKKNCLPAGFLASGVASGIKKSRKKDLALFYSAAPCVASAMLTVNKVQAAPLHLCRRHLRKKPPRAIVVNSGNANCMTGRQGFKNAAAMASEAARRLRLVPEEVLVSSTGIIGRPLPMAAVVSGIAKAACALSPKGFQDAAEAILTTDTFAKVVSRRLSIGGRAVTISGVAKGAGMVAPRMKSATMLAYILTDAAVAKPLLDRLTREIVEDSFNAITIDGCMSTNDTVIVLANGASGAKPVTDFVSEDGKRFAAVLREVFVGLAKLIVLDAEGATKFIEIHVRGASTDAEAMRLAHAVADSTLFKCAMFASDPNWGRIAAALGSVESRLDAAKLDIVMNKKYVFRAGRPVPLAGNSFLKKRRVVVDINLGQGRASSCVYTCDFSYDYVKINAAYN